MDIAHVLFFLVLVTLTFFFVIKNAKKNLANIQLFWSFSFSVINNFVYVK